MNSDSGVKLSATIIAPASKTTASDLEAIQQYLKEQLPLTPVLSSTIYANDPFYANSDELRAADLVSALTDNSKIVWCVRGGYGTSRLIPYLEKLPTAIKLKIKNNPHKKIVIGYSDITALHLYLQKKYHWQTLHATMLADIVNHKVDQHSIDQLVDLIINNKKCINIDNLTLINPQYVVHPALFSKAFKIDSTVIGGNLTLIENSIGTAWQIELANKILFLEDVLMSPTVLERSLDHLQQAGVLKGVKAVVFGDFTGSAQQALLTLVQKRFASAVPYPVFTVTGIGHGDTKIPLPLNTRAIIKTHKTQQGLFSMTVDNLYQAP